ncbi:hypothetical protein [Streptomyces sp. DSM 40907]|uniref:hypothetical protein n=1 Tax=Streptomyces kutzneri TaxID=3051179 RepID=UPI0028D0BB7F|nr:hypothetical protein [Streptomyces sp. DSM 40907]
MSTHDPDRALRSPAFYLAAGIAAAVAGIALVAVATWGLLPVAGDNTVLKHGPQLVGIALIVQGTYWIAKSRSREDSS